MAKNKTKPTGASVKDYIASRANEQQRADVRELMALLKSITKYPPKMWGPSMVGYGSQRYTYTESQKQKALLAKLGKHSMGKSCLYFRQLVDLDKSVLKQIVAGSIAEFRQRYGSRPTSSDP